MVHIKVSHFTLNFNEILDTGISNYRSLIWKV